MKLPIAEILVEAFRFPWMHRREFGRGLVVPLSGLITLIVAWQNWQSDGFRLGHWIFWLLYLLLFCWLAVGCHRLVLLKPDARTTDMKWSRRETLYLIWLISLYALWMLVNFFFSIALGPFVGSKLQTDGALGALFATLVTLPGWYLFARCSLALPAVALDHRTSLGHAWTLSRGNGARIFLLVCLFPWALDGAFGLLLSQSDNWLADLLYGITLPLLYVCEICVLSLTYGFLTRETG